MLGGVCRGTTGVDYVRGVYVCDDWSFKRGVTTVNVRRGV